MKLRLTYGDDDRATISIDDDPQQMITVRCRPISAAVARAVVRAVNRDHLFDALVSTLTPFRSDEMGELLIGALFHPYDSRADEAQGEPRRSAYFSWLPNFFQLP